MNMHDLDDDFLASAILGDMDYDSQLRAIHALLRTQSKASRDLASEIKEIEVFSRSVSGSANDHAIDEWVDRLHESVFQDAAHSMSAVGMLAPFSEALFKRAYFGIFALLGQSDFCKDLHHPRWQMQDRKVWDCRYSLEGRKDIFLGIASLNDALGMRKFMPPGLDEVLYALISYRNKMFHSGFEWPVSERRNFKVTMERAGWPAGWFLDSKRGPDTWIIYMSNVFIAHCLDTLRGVIGGFGRYVREFHEFSR